VYTLLNGAISFDLRWPLVPQTISFLVITQQWPNKLELGSVHPSVNTYVHPCTKSYFSDFDLIWYVGRPRPDMCTSMTSTQSKVKIKVTELLKFRKLHFSMSISSTILVWSSKLVVDYDNMRPRLQLVRAFWISFSVSYHVTSNFTECWYYSIFKGSYFPIAWGYSHMVGYAGSSICIVHADMTLTWSKVKVTGAETVQHLQQAILLFEKTQTDTVRLVQLCNFLSSAKRV